MLESDPTLALFIVDIRSKQKEDLNEYIINHRLEIARHDKNSGRKALNLIHRHVFLAAFGYQFDSTHFYHAISSMDKKIKRLGYLGASFCKNVDLKSGIFNLLKNDISDPNAQRCVINYLATLDLTPDGYKILMPKIKSLMLGQAFKAQAEIIYYKITPSIENLSLFEKGEMQFFLKIQIVIDKLNDNPNVNDIKFLEKRNEVDFVYTMLRKTDKYFIKTKCIQFLSLTAKYKCKVDQNMLKYVDDSINIVRLLKKTATEIGYYIECVKFLLDQECPSNKTHTFVFKMLESKHEIYMKIAAHFSMKYGIYKDVAIDKCIFVGLNDEDMLDLFLKMICKQNYNAIYMRKQEIILTLEGRDCSDETIEKIIEKFLKRIFLFCNSKEAAKIYLEEPLFCIKQPIYNHVIEEDRMKMHEEIKNKKDPMYFSLIYQTIENALVPKKHVTMATEHLTILYEYCMFNCSDSILSTLSYLLSLLTFIGDYKLVQNTMIKMYSESIKKRENDKFSNILLSKILFYNIFLDEKVFYMANDLFIWYRIVRDGINKKVIFRCSSAILEVKVLLDDVEILPEKINMVDDGYTDRIFNGFNGTIKLSCINENLKYENKVTLL